MKPIQAEIKSVKDILGQNLAIPEYQRPYRWQEENVALLLQDIYNSWNNKKNAYRVGSIILHPENEHLFIVDGQQRITTLLLILKCLGSNVGNKLRKSLNYQHIESKNAIVENHAFIKTWIEQNLKGDETNFHNYLIRKCQFVEISVVNLSEAFQMFDTQNGRGKELEPYNLLKAYHIKLMENDAQAIKIECDKRWENTAKYQKIDILKQIFDEQLYRTRVWSRKEAAYRFTKKEINEFKGTTFLQDKALFPYQNIELLHFIAYKYYFLFEDEDVKKRFNNLTSDKIQPFVQINQRLINGKWFFNYINTYAEIYIQIFIKGKLKDFNEFYQSYCEKYDGSYRDGDKYLKELYKSLVFLVFDRFGEDGLMQTYQMLYLLVYRNRLEKRQVKYAFVADYSRILEIFYIIENAKSISDLRPLEKQARKEIKCVKKVEKIMSFFKEKNIVLIYD